MADYDDAALPPRSAANGPSKARVANPVTQDSRRSLAERLNFCLIDFRFLNSPEQRWHRLRCSSQACESAASNSPSKNACRTSLQSEQGPYVLMPMSGAAEQDSQSQRTQNALRLTAYPRRRSLICDEMR